MSNKPTAPISLDLDNKWSYLMVHAEPTWVDYPSYLPTLVPRVLDFLDERSLRITFFIVGQDATLPGHAELLAEIVRRGHRIANHSHDHKPWLHRYTPREFSEELDRAEEAIEAATGEKTIGFRGPGFSLTDEAIGELATRGYAYDATVFPNILNPLSRAYYFRTTKLTPEQLEERAALFGTISDSLRPNKPFNWNLGENQKLLEIPVTTLPGLRTPTHLSYLSYLGGKAAACGHHLLPTGAGPDEGNAQSTVDVAPPSRLPRVGRRQRSRVLSWDGHARRREARTGAPFSRAAGGVVSPGADGGVCGRHRPPKDNCARLLQSVCWPGFFTLDRLPVGADSQLLAEHSGPQVEQFVEITLVLS